MPSPVYEELLQNNRKWAAHRLVDDPGFFERLAQQQKPKFLWIGCSDSRVPANEITGTDPGEIFVHRNIANLVVHTDLNMLTVLDYAVNVLHVEHVIVCGHHGCGGVKAALGNKDYGLINKWLRNIKDVYYNNMEKIDQCASEQVKVDTLVELTAVEQLWNLAKTSIVQKAWKERQAPVLHAWVYDLQDGLLKELYHLEPGCALDPIYQYEIE
ncbi:carbonate dehydratase [bacterium]|nr:carbonate dehydratase [bacterium]